jgi:hypothetical protein
MSEMGKTIFIVDSWVPFPVSEYGGVQVVVADDEAEAVQLIAALDMDYEKGEYPDYMERIAKEVKEAVRFPVDSPVSEVVYQFLT